MHLFHRAGGLFLMKFLQEAFLWRKQLSEKNTRALMAAAAITHDRKIYPKEEKNQTGKVRWDGSEAQRLLPLDMDAGKSTRR
jgi:hypothetical protein